MDESKMTAAILGSSFVRNFVALPKSSKALALAVLVGGAYYASKPTKSKSKRKDADQKKDEVPFKERLIKILRILFAGSGRKTTMATLGFLTAFLVSRTLLSIQVAVVTGQVAQHLVQQEWPEFVQSVLRFALVGVPAAFVNSGLKYCTNQLSLRFRRNLTNYINSQYIVGTNFYAANELPASKIDNVDQRVTADVEAFCDQLANLYTSIFKPLLDIVLNTMKLSGMMGFKAPVVLFVYYLFLAQIKMLILRVVDLKRNAQIQSELQGDYRTAHSRLITYAEEIAFFEGSAREQTIIQGLFGKLFKHTAKLNYLQGLVGIVDQYLIKYGASITGYALLCLPVFFPKTRGERTTAELTRDYVLNRQLLMDLAGGIGVLLSTTTKVASFMGITARVSEVLERVKTLDRAGSLGFVLRPNEEVPKETAVAEVSDEWLVEWRERGEALRASGARSQTNRLRVSPSVARFDLEAKVPLSAEEEEARGRWVEGDIIELKDATIVSPDGRLLVSDVNLEVPYGRNIMITGPNGSGKSSIFRVIGELWPPYRGVVVKPPKEDIVFVPQKPYLVMGTLRDQIIYPHSHEDMKRLGVTDEDLTRLLDVVDPARSITREWRFDEIRNWALAFSGGQKQRIAMARVFYHRPRYAILDECTSAVSSEVEGKIYMTARKLGITLFTVSHRENLQKYHEYQFRVDGHGGWKLLTREEVEANPRVQ